MNKKTITKGPVRGVRFDETIDNYISLIADYEDRSISYVISYLVSLSIWAYLDALCNNDKDFEKRLGELNDAEDQRREKEIKELVNSPDGIKMLIEEAEREISQLKKDKAHIAPSLEQIIKIMGLTGKDRARVNPSLERLMRIKNAKINKGTTASETSRTPE